MSEIKSINEGVDSRDDALIEAYAKANEAFDEEDMIEEAAATFFGVTIEYVRRGQTGLHPTPRIGSWIKERRKEAGWKYFGE
jgi:hypothetical protein